MLNVIKKAFVILVIFLEANSRKKNQNKNFNLNYEEPIFSSKFATYFNKLLSILYIQGQSFAQVKEPLHNNNNN